MSCSFPRNYYVFICTKTSWAVSNVELRRRRFAVAAAGKHRVGSAAAHIVHVQHLRHFVALKQNARHIQFGRNDNIVFALAAGVMAAGAIFVETCA